MKLVAAGLLVLDTVSVFAGQAAPEIGQSLEPRVHQQTITQAQLSDAERSWEAIKNTTSVAVLKAFIARYGNTKFAALARERLAKIDVKRPPPPISALKDTATSDEMLAEIPIDEAMLRLVESHEFFNTNVLVAARSYSLTRTRTEVYGGYRTTTTTDEKASVRPIRGSIVRLELTGNETTTQAGSTSKYVRQDLEICAANGLVDLAIKSRGADTPASEQVTTLVAIKRMDGRIFPLRLGNKFSIEAIYKQVDRTAPEQFLQTRSCEVVAEEDASKIHPNLQGHAFVTNCEFRISYKRSKRFTGSIGKFKANYKSAFIPQLGIWLDITGTYRLKDFQTTR
jgi:hypothetical protein